MKWQKFNTNSAKTCNFTAKASNQITKLYHIRSYQMQFNLVTFCGDCREIMEFHRFTGWDMRLKPALNRGTWVAQMGVAQLSNRVWQDYVLSALSDQRITSEPPIWRIWSAPRRNFLSVWPGVWIVLWYGVDNLNRELSRVCPVWSETDIIFSCLCRVCFGNLNKIIFN